MYLQIYPLFGIVKLRETPSLSRLKRSAVEGRINNLEAAMKRSNGALAVNLTVPFFGILERDFF